MQTLFPKKKTTTISYPVSITSGKTYVLIFLNVSGLPRLKCYITYVSVTYKFKLMIAMVFDDMPENRRLLPAKY